MKTIIQKSAFLIALPALLILGCGGKEGSTTESTTTPSDKGATAADAPEASKTAGLTPGTYEWREGSGDKEAYGVLKVISNPAGGFKFSILAGYGMNTGFLGGTMTQNELHPDVMDLHIEEPKGDDMDCSLSASIKGEHVKIDATMPELAQCGGGLNVSFLGNYKRTSTAVPTLDHSM